MLSRLWAGAQAAEPQPPVSPCPSFPNLLEYQSERPETTAWVQNPDSSKLLDKRSFLLIADAFKSRNKLFSAKDYTHRFIFWFVTSK